MCSFCQQSLTRPARRRWSAPWLGVRYKHKRVCVCASICLDVYPHVYSCTYPNPSHAVHLSILYLSASLSLSRSLALSLARAHTNTHAHRVKGLGGVRQRQVVSGQYRRVYPRTARLHCAWHKRISLSLAFSLSPPLPLPLSFSHTQVQVRAVYVADGAHSVGRRTTMRHASSSRPRRLPESRQPVRDTTRESSMPAVQTDAQGWICVSRFND